MWRGISLANKCLLVFGGAIVLIVLSALSVPFLRMNTLVDDGQLEVSRMLSGAWEKADAEARASADGSAEAERDAEASRVVDRVIRQGGSTGDIPAPVQRAGIGARRLSLEQAEALSDGDRFLAGALATFRSQPTRLDVQAGTWKGSQREYRYARAVRSPEAGSSELTGIVLLERRSIEATRLLLINIGYLLGAGSVVLGLALLVFYLITHKLILEPVRSLKETAERVREGDISIRSEIRTGDEFEELAETFNLMLTDLQTASDQQRAVNRAMDLRLNELAESNVALYEAAKVKGEFLANVSHELRTPLNSIIGFAELLRDLARADAEAFEAAEGAAPAGMSHPINKRLRYVENILNAGRNLREMIDTLLEMARIEAGKVQLHPERTVVKDVCEGLGGLIAPLADRKGIALKVDVADDLPVIVTDAKRFQQVIFNFLSNAVKFTPGTDASGRPGQITIRAERLPGWMPPGMPAGSTVAGAGGVRVSVIDNGPGIPREELERIFEKFHQLDSSHTKQHTGTGLGLAICKELARLLHGEIQLVSELGRGSMFSLILPMSLETAAALAPETRSARDTVTVAQAR